MTWTPLHAQALADVFKALNDHGFRWLVLRNHEGLPQTNRSKDIDIGIEKPMLRRAERVVMEVMKRHGLTRSETTVFEWGRCTSYFGTLPDSPMSIKIDLMNGFSWRGAEIFDTARYLENAVRYGDFLIPHPADDATIMWLKPFLTGGFVKAAYVPGLKAGLRDHPEHMKRTIDTLFRPDLASRAWECLASGQFEALTPLQKTFAWNAWRRNFARRPFQVMGNVFAYVGLELLRRSRRPAATLLAVQVPAQGSDDFVEALCAAVATIQVKDADAIKVRTLGSAAPRSAGGPDRPVATISTPWDYIRQYYHTIRRACVAGRTTILLDHSGDRADSAAGASWVSRALAALAPRPDVVIQVGTPGTHSFGTNGRADKRITLDPAAPLGQMTRRAIEGLIHCSYREF